MKQKNQNAIELIKEQESKLIAVHWKDKDEAPVLIRVRELSDLQIQSIGNFSLLGEKNNAPVKDFRSISAMSQLHANIVKAALISPTYSELCAIAGVGDFSKTVEEKCKEIEKDIEKLPRGPVRSGYEQQLAAARMLCETVLPNIFMSEIVEWVLGINRTNIKLVTDEIILNAAFMQASAKTGRISDYIDDKTLSAFNKRDIDTRGIVLYTEWNNKKRGNK